MKKLFIFLTYASAICAINWSEKSDKHYEDMMYNDTIQGIYEEAVYIAVHLVRESRGSAVQNVVTRLIRDSKTNVIDLAYQLWIFNEGQAIVRSYFPDKFKLLFSQNAIKIINVRDKLALKLGGTVDKLGDRVAYGDGSDTTSENISWKLIPVWDENKVYMKIYGINRRQYLKVEVKGDSANDHAAYGDNLVDTRRHEWYLKPVNHEGKILFYIYNRRYNQGLKLGRSADYAGDRQAYSHNGDIEGEPQLFGWNIVSYY